MRSLLLLLAAMLLGLGCAACGEAGKDAGSASRTVSDSTAAGSAGSDVTSTPAELEGDEDNDNHGEQSHYDSDDGEILNYGHAASAADAQAVSTLVKRYYAAAATQDSAKACALIYYILAETIPEDYAQPPGPRYLQGAKTCQAVLGLVFERFHAQLSQPIEVTGVRVYGDLAYALLGSKTMPAGYIEVRREGDAWKIDRVLALPLP